MDDNVSSDVVQSGSDAPRNFYEGRVGGNKQVQMVSETGSQLIWNEVVQYYCTAS
jgi:hypothetical protein